MFQFEIGIVALLVLTLSGPSPAGQEDPGAKAVTKVVSSCGPVMMQLVNGLLTAPPQRPFLTALDRDEWTKHSALLAFKKLSFDVQTYVAKVVDEHPNDLQQVVSILRARATFLDKSGRRSDINALIELVSHLLSGIKRIAIIDSKVFPKDPDELDRMYMIGNHTIGLVERKKIPFVTESANIALGLAAPETGIFDHGVEDFAAGITVLFEKPAFNYTSWPKIGLCTDKDIQPGNWKETFSRIASRLSSEARANGKPRVFFNLTGMAKNKVRGRRVTWWELEYILKHDVQTVFYLDGKEVPRETAQRIYDGNP